ncbi:MAG TPA: NUDIX domain-containing protein [Candidatus Saccharimonadales bacterium]|nr:NUDIX domain-containing protein [Candidatus Saccharimonadales bacterium]
MRRPDGSTGYQVVNSYAAGVSLVPLILVNDELYVVLHDEMRYPLPQAGDDNLSIEESAALARTGRWSREIPSGGVNAGESIKAAALREAGEESGIIGLTEADLHPIFGTFYSSVSTNRQSFNPFWAIVRPEQWQPELVMPDIEEGNFLGIGAYSLRHAVPHMFGRQIVELSTFGFISALHHAPELRQYL